MADNYTPRTVGSLSSSGKEFKILASNVSFEVLAMYDEHIREANSTVDTDNNISNALASDSGVGANIANSLIVCAPQMKSYTTIVNASTNYSFIDKNGDKVYDKEEGDKIISGSYEPEINVINQEGTEDTGKYDLVVTDYNGVPGIITPPFNDIDKNYFTVSNSNVDPSRSKYCRTVSLTFNPEMSDTIGRAHKFIDEATYAFTYNTPNERMYLIEVRDDGPGGQPSRYYTTNEELTLSKDLGTNGYKYYSYTYYDDENNLCYIYDDGNTIINPANYSYILNEYLKLRKWKEENFSYIPANGEEKWKEYFRKEEFTYMNDKINWLLEKVYGLVNSKFLYRADDTVPTYLWSGNKENYGKILNAIKDGTNKTYTDTIYVVQGE